MPAHQKGYCTEAPELIELCTNCKRTNCDGRPCARYIEVARRQTVRGNYKRRVVMEKRGKR